MIRYSFDINLKNTTSSLIRIDGYEMVKDLTFLHTLENEELPLQINRKWHPQIYEIFKKRLAGKESNFEVRKNQIKGYKTDFYIYERDPIDDWSGYDWLFLGDLILDKRWLNLLNHTLTILKMNSKWEGDIREGPFIARFPGDEYMFSSFIVLLKQDNDGTTYVVSRYPLENISEYLIKCHIANKVRY